MWEKNLLRNLCPTKTTRAVLSFLFRLLDVFVSHRLEAHAVRLLLVNLFFFFVSRMK